MICKNCPEGRRYARGSVNCILYGIIIREEHECIREGGKRHEGAAPAADHGDNGEDRTELRDDGWAAVDRLQGIF